ncbi:hypothetical protein [Leeuwenhoekiella sp. CH_XMU1409-2]|uniref:hypothetical protein n=1 Tax=Leeuwenhoekiella sp. CH_XMU1409-2 TaxID=3107768 RepID=UPI00300B27D1
MKSNSNQVEEKAILSAVNILTGEIISKGTDYDEVFKEAETSGVDFYVETIQPENHSFIF